jgi:GT2 family glycosyltransferase
MDSVALMKTLAIVVNYLASDLIEESVTSILGSPSLGPVQVVIVDNSQDSGESAKLHRIFSGRREVELIVSGENMGFGRACNTVFDHYDGDMILLLNPDARLFDDCLVLLQKVLTSSANIGAVGPQVFWDDKRGFKLPPSYPPVLHWLQPMTSVGSPDSAINRIISAIWRGFAVKVWRASVPIRVQNLSGGNVLLKREAVLKAGGLFDPRFFLYYEDTDLFIRLRQSGYRLLVAPGATAIHYYDQCGQGNWSRKRRLMAESHRSFMKKHGNGWRLFPEKIAASFLRFSHQPSATRVMEIFDGPFVLNVPDDLKKKWLFEWSPNPDFVPAAGRFGEGPVMEFSQDCWRLLAPGTYYGRIGNPYFMGRTYSNWMWFKE